MFNQTRANAPAKVSHLTEKHAEETTARGRDALSVSLNALVSEIGPAEFVCTGKERKKNTTCWPNRS